MRYHHYYYVLSLGARPSRTQPPHSYRPVWHSFSSPDVLLRLPWDAWVVAQLLVTGWVVAPFQREQQDERTSNMLRCRCRSTLSDFLGTQQGKDAFVDLEGRPTVRCVGHQSVSISVSWCQLVSVGGALIVWMCLERLQERRLHSVNSMWGV